MGDNFLFPSVHNYLFRSLTLILDEFQYHN